MPESPCSPKINLNSFDVDSLVDEFLDWRAYVKDKVIVLQHDDSGELLKLPWVTRFSEGYRKKLYAKFMTLVRSLGRAPCSVIFGTLTVDPKKLSKLEALRQIKGAWHNLHMLLNNRYKARTGKKGMEYVCCVEPHQSGMIHLHYLIFWAKPSDFVDDCQYVDRWNTNRQEWVKVGVSPSLDLAWQKYGFGHINQFEGVQFDKQRLKQVASYLLKYVSKQHANLPFAAALWRLKVRSYSASRLITSLMLQVLADKKDKCWSFLGVISFHVADSCSDWELIEVFATLCDPGVRSNSVVLNKHGT